MSVVISAVLFLMFGVLLIVQCYDSLRSAITGTQPTESAPSKDPKAIPTRFAGLAWGIAAGLLAFGCFFALLFGTH